MEEVDKNFATDKSSLFIRFPEELIVGETLPGQDSSVELEMIVDSENKLDVNCLNEYGHTALGTAAFVGSIRCCEVLIRLGADVSKKDADGWTAMHYAMARGYLNIVKYLILFGGDLNVVNNDGDSPLEFIEDDEMRQVLLDFFDEHSKEKLSVQF